MRHRSYKVEWIILGCAILFAFASIVGDCFYDSWNWFARSGSVIVLFSVVVEYRIYGHIYEDIQRAQFQQSKINLSLPIKATPTKQKNRISVVTHVLIVFGTIIWGYGDLF